MFIKYFFAVILTILTISTAFAQRPPRQPGMPMPGGNQPPRHDWLKDIDSNNDQKVDSTELQAAIETSFAEFDKNTNGSIESNEIQRPPRDGRPVPPIAQGMRQPGPPAAHRSKKILPPFFFADRVADGVSTSKSDFEKIVRYVFDEMDKNGDGFITREEAHPPRLPENIQSLRPPPPNAKFIGAELRFGDKLVKGQPFSADIVIEDTRRLFDGSTATKTRRGAIYRDGDGRTRREQPLEMIAGISIVGGDNKPQKLVFINDFAAQTQTFLDVNNKIARVNRLGGTPPFREPKQPENSKTESLGKKTIDGVEVVGTRVTFEIPVGELGNDKPLQVVTESWFSTELQMILLSRHIDPIAGEHLFKLVNIKRSEPSSDLFTIPNGFRLENKINN